MLPHGRYSKLLLKLVSRTNAFGSSTQFKSELREGYITGDGNHGNSGQIGHHVLLTITRHNATCTQYIRYILHHPTIGAYRRDKSWTRGRLFCDNCPKYVHPASESVGTPPAVHMHTMHCPLTHLPTHTPSSLHTMLQHAHLYMYVVA